MCNYILCRSCKTDTLCSIKIGKIETNWCCVSGSFIITFRSVLKWFTNFVSFWNDPNLFYKSKTHFTHIRTSIRLVEKKTFSCVVSLTPQLKLFSCRCSGWPILYNTAIPNRTLPTYKMNVAQFLSADSKRLFVEP